MIQKVVVFIAAVVGVKELDNPVDSIIINVEGTYILRLCAKHVSIT